MTQSRPFVNRPRILLALGILATVGAMAALLPSLPCLLPWIRWGVRVDECFEGQPVALLRVEVDGLARGARGKVRLFPEAAVPDGSALEEAMQMAQDLARGSMNAFGLAKRLLTDSFDGSFESQIERERQGLSRCASHPDGQEGLKAFAEKRKPVFAPL